MLVKKYVKDLCEGWRGYKKKVMHFKIYHSSKREDFQAYFFCRL